LSFVERRLARVVQAALLFVFEIEMKPPGINEAARPGIENKGELSTRSDGSQLAVMAILIAPCTSLLTVTTRGLGNGGLGGAGG
jgi:hypothetical protein